MTEARITCTCAHIIIADLGLRMAQGSVVYVDESKARRSKDLMLAARANGVNVHFVTRSQVVRQPVDVPVGRPKRDLPKLSARVSPIPPATVFTPALVQFDVITTDPVTTYDPPGVVEATETPLEFVSVEDVLGIADGIFDEKPHKTRKKKPTDGKD
jgi:hypothetical protein